MFSVIATLFLAGITLGSGPCLATCGPLLIAYSTGTGKDVFKGLTTYLLFSLSRISAYLALSLAIFFTGKIALEGFMRSGARYIFIAGGSLILLLGILVFFSQIAHTPCKSLSRHILQQDKKAVVLMGFFMGIVPCVPLLAVLSYIGLLARSWPESLLYGASFGLGTFFSPLVILIALSGFIPRISGSTNGFYPRIFNMICGLVMMFFGVQFIWRGL